MNFQNTKIVNTCNEFSKYKNRYLFQNSNESPLIVCIAMKAVNIGENI